MQPKVMTVTPEMARGWLENQHDNRPTNKSLVDSLRRAIESGRWDVTNQGIAFDDAGRLVDGQHRLLAIAQSGRSVQLLCVFGVSREVALRSVDQGVKRTVAQLARMQGMKNAAEKAGICRTIWIATSGSSLADRFAPADFNTILSAWQTEIELVIPGKDVPGFTTSVLGGMALALRMKSGTEFVDGAISGANLSATDPRLVLRSTLGGNHARITRRQNLQADRLLRTIAAADAFESGDKIERIQISRNRYLRFCERARIPVSSPLMSYATSMTRGSA